jgi:hypothetical protein
MKWFDLVEVIFIADGRSSTAPTELSVVPSLQQSLNGGCYLYCIELFTEVFCHLSPLCAALENA